MPHFISVSVLVVALLCPALSLQAQVGPFGWIKGITGPEQSGSFDITVDNSGNIFCLGGYTDSIDLDPGPGIIHGDTTGIAGMFIQKFAPNGQLIWAKSIAPLRWNLDFSIATGPTGNCYITGSYRDSVDFDPGPGSAMLYQDSVVINFYENMFILKLDANGDFSWVKSIGQEGHERGSDIAVDANEDVYSCGTFRGPIDLDPGPGVNPDTTADPLTKAFVVKLDAQGNHLWSHSFGSDYAFSPKINSDINGDLVITGAYSEAGDYNPGPGVDSLSADWFHINTFIMKWTAAGDLLWVTDIDSKVAVRPDDVTTDHSGQILISGLCNDTADLDPGPGVFSFPTLNGQTTADRFFILKLDQSGQFVWAKPADELGHAHARALCTDPMNNVYTSGVFFRGTDLNTGTGIQQVFSDYTGSCYIQKLDSSGHFQSASFWSFSNAGIAMTSNAAGDVFLAGSYFVTGDFDPGPDSAILVIHSAFGSGEFVLKLDQSDNTSGSLVVHACDSFANPADQTTLYTSGIYLDTLSDGNGNDSISTLALTLGNTTTGNTTVVVCDSFLLPGSDSAVYQTGSYQSILINESGCDSLLTTNVQFIFPDSLMVLQQADSLIVLADSATYQWLNCDNALTPIQGATNSSFAPTVNGNYAVAVTKNGCTDTSACFNFDPVGIPEFANNWPVLIYPNPTSGTIALDLGRPLNQAAIVLRNSLGQVVQQRSLIQQQSVRLTLPPEAGLYLLEIKQLDQLIVRERIVRLPGW